MEWYNNKACITFQELTRNDNGDAIITKYAYDRLKNRNKLNVVRRGCYETPALIEFESLPLKYRDAYEAKYGNPKKLVSPSYYLLEQIEIDPRAEHYFKSYKKSDGSFLSVEKQDEKTLNASILNAIDKIMTDRLTLRRALGNNKRGGWTAISDEVNKLKEGDKYNYHSLPKNPRRLQDKLDKYKRNGYVEFIHKNEGNVNANKVKSDEQDAVILKLASDPRNLDNEMIATLYNIVAAQCSWETITSGTVANWRKNNSMLVTYGTRGETELRNTKTMQVKRVAPSTPMQYWTADGWDAELLYQDKKMDKNKHWITTYHNRLTVVVVLDPFLRYPIGYAIGTHENPALIKEAFRNAIKHTKELFGRYYKPLQLQTDNYGRGNLKSFYSALSDKYTPARAHNAKSKVVEPFFLKTNNLCKLKSNWSGYGVTSKKANQPNMDELQKSRQLWPDQKGCAEQIVSIMEIQRKENLSSYLEAWKNVREEDKIEMTKEEYLMMFGEVTGYTNTLEGQGVGVTLLGQKVWFDSFDLDFRNWGHRDFIIKYDPSDLSEVLAVVNDGTKKEPIEGTKCFTLEQKHIQHMSLHEQTDEDRLQLQRVHDFNSAAEIKLISQRQKATELVGDLFDEHPALNDTLTKFMITDSKGQHKNQRNIEAHRFEDAEIIEIPQLNHASTECYEVADFNPMDVLNQL